MNEGILPSRKTNTEMAMEEERRLAFVAITRAEDGLYLSDAEGRNFDNSPRYVSRFILDISPLYLSYDEELPDSLIKDSDRFIKRSENSLLPDLGELGLKVGDRVTHPVFKEGTITDISLSEEAIFIQFDSLASPRGIALRAARKLKKSSS
jgi:DNA helicase-2/ATP-dependent DNA helicase PcrA